MWKLQENENKNRGHNIIARHNSIWGKNLLKNNGTFPIDKYFTIHIKCFWVLLDPIFLILQIMWFWLKLIWMGQTYV